MADNLGHHHDFNASTVELIKNEITPVYLEYVKLVEEESPRDPDSEPYRSLYLARERLLIIKDKIEGCHGDIKESKDDYASLCVSVHSLLGSNYFKTDETSSGQREFERVLELAEGVIGRWKVAISMVTALNQLGILWCNRSEEYDKSLELLLKAKSIYESSPSPIPLGEQDWLLGETRDRHERENAFEDLHTHTLFYLAQIYTHLDQPKLSAEYCQATLSRQLETKSYDHIEWALNAATLSQYYINCDNFPQARHCLAAATVVFRRYDDEVGVGDLDLRERLERTKGDISRCWIKYCILLLRQSDGGCEGVAQTREKVELVHRFEPLELSDTENEIHCDWIENQRVATNVFLFAQKHIDEAKHYFTLDDHASEHVAIVQDHSQLFKFLTVYEVDLSLKCRMHKRRIDMLSFLLSQLNPQYYLVLNRQLMFELGDTCAEMSNHKIVLASGGGGTPSRHQVNKINTLLRDAIKHFQNYFDSFNEEDFDSSFLRSYLTSKLNVSRLHAKLLGFTPEEQVATLETSLKGYHWLLEYAHSHEDKVKGVFDEEIQLSQEMIELLPQKIELIKMGQRVQ